MTIEEKAKAYDEALERAKNTREVNQTIPDVVECVESLFPVLKESEDERIIERIKKAVESYWSDEPLDEILAWLEKQGEKKPVHEIEPTPIFRIGDILKRKGKDYTFRVDRIQGGYYHCDRNNGAFFPIEEQGNWELVGQKPADLKTKAGNWYVCDMEVMNENMVTAFHRNEIYYCPKDGYLDVRGALFEVGCLDVFRLATEKEIIALIEQFKAL